MFVEFKRTLHGNRGQIVVWGLGLILYSLLLVLITANIPSFSNKIPTRILTFFGGSPGMVYDLGVFLDVFFFNPLVLILGIQVVNQCAKILVTGKEDLQDKTHSGREERTSLFWAKVLGFLVTLSSILALSWLSWSMSSRYIGLGLSPVELLRPFLVLFGQLVLFGFLSLLLSEIFGTTRMAGFLVGGFLAKRKDKPEGGAADGQPGSTG